MLAKLDNLFLFLELLDNIDNSCAPIHIETAINHFSYYTCDEKTVNRMGVATPSVTCSRCCFRNTQNSEERFKEIIDVYKRIKATEST